MNKISTLLLGVTVIILILTACVPGLGTANQDPGPIYTQAAQTIEATMTMGAMLNALTTQQAEQLEPTSTQAVIEEPTTTPLPESTATIEPTITYFVPMISATKNTNCREGPGAQWAVISALLVGEKVPVKGKSVSGTWWLIQDPKQASKTCWVWTDTTNVEGKTDSLPIIETPPTPTPEKPAITVSSSVSPTTFNGACPKTLTLKGTVTVSRPTKVEYAWVSDFGMSIGGGKYEFDEAGSKTFTKTIEINSDTTGFLRFRVEAPFSVKADRIEIKINCD